MNARLAINDEWWMRFPLIALKLKALNSFLVPLITMNNSLSLDRRKWYDNTRFLNFRSLPHFKGYSCTICFYICCCFIKKRVNSWIKMRLILAVFVIIGVYAHSLNACSTSKNLSYLVIIFNFYYWVWFNVSQNLVNPLSILGNAKENSILCRDCKFCSSGSGDESKPKECKQSDGYFSCLKRVETDTGNQTLLSVLLIISL